MIYYLLTFTTELLFTTTDFDFTIYLSLTGLLTSPQDGNLDYLCDNTTTLSAAVRAQIAASGRESGGGLLYPHPFCLLSTP